MGKQRATRKAKHHGYKASRLASGRNNDDRLTITMLQGMSPRDANTFLEKHLILGNGWQPVALENAPPPQPRPGTKMPVNSTHPRRLQQTKKDTSMTNAPIAKAPDDMPEVLTKLKEANKTFPRPEPIRKLWLAVNKGQTAIAKTTPPSLKETMKIFPPPDIAKKEITDALRELGYIQGRKIRLEEKIRMLAIEYPKVAAGFSPLIVMKTTEHKPVYKQPAALKWALDRGHNDLTKIALNVAAFNKHALAGEIDWDGLEIEDNVTTASISTKLSSLMKTFLS